MTWTSGIILMVLNAAGACYGYTQGIWLWPANLAMAVWLLWVYYKTEVKASEEELQSSWEKSR